MYSLRVVSCHESKIFLKKFKKKVIESTYLTSAQCIEELLTMFISLLKFAPEPNSLQREFLGKCVRSIGLTI